MDVTFEKAIVAEVTKKALKGMDVDAMAKRLTPQLVARIEKAIIEKFEGDYYLDEVFEWDEIQEVVVEVVKMALCKAYDITPKKKGTKK